MKKIMASIFACLLFMMATAQPDSTAAPVNRMNNNWDAGIVNTLKQSGGIYAVIAVIAIIIAGFFLYMMRLEKKISRLEAQQKN